MAQQVNYIKHLQRYFNEHYGNYDESAEWSVDPAPNKWEFVIRVLGIRVILTCHEDGKISEIRRGI